MKGEVIISNPESKAVGGRKGDQSERQARWFKLSWRRREKGGEDSVYKLKTECATFSKRTVYPQRDAVMRGLDKPGYFLLC